MHWIYLGSLTYFRPARNSKSFRPLPHSILVSLWYQRNWSGLSVSLLEFCLFHSQISQRNVFLISKTVTLEWDKLAACFGRSLWLIWDQKIWTIILWFVPLIYSLLLIQAFVKVYNAFMTNSDEKMKESMLHTILMVYASLFASIVLSDFQWLCISHPRIMIIKSKFFFS